MKKRLTKAAALIAVISVICGVCSSCGNKTATVDEQGRTIISVADWPQKSGAELDNMEKLKAEFEAENPDVVIQPDSWTFDLKTFYPKAEAGLLPTVYGTAFTEVPVLVNSGYPAGLSEALSKRGYDGKFNEKVLDIISEDGEIYAFPWAAYVLGLAYNTELFEQAGLMEEDGTPKQPKDWYELAEFAVQIKEKTGKSGFMFPTANNVGGWMFTALAWSFGTDFMEQDENGDWKATFNTPECAEALQYIKDLKWKYDVLPANTLIDSEEYYKTFSVGNAGMIMAAGDVTDKVVKYDMKPDQIGLMGIPAGPKRHVTLLGGSILCVAAEATDEQKDAAIRWFEKRGYGCNADDVSKKSIEDDIKTKLDGGQLIGVKSMSPWNNETEIVSYRNSVIDKYANSNPNHVRLYNEFVTDSSVEIQPEEPVCTQDLYGVLDNCIQEVLTDENADCAAILEKANDDFQRNYLDNLDY